MAELLIGEHCSMKNCNTLDFLPLKCDKCEQIFCKNHLNYFNHICDKFKEKIVIEAVNANFGANGSLLHYCAYKNCTNMELVKIICPLCGLNFCLQHRLDIDHKCTNIPKPIDKLENTKRCVQNILSENTNKSGKIQSNLKTNSPTMNMINLMKLKQKSIGDIKIPQPDRFYFKLINESDCITPITEFFVDKHWTAGKILDYVIASNEIENFNNIASKKKLILCDGSNKLEMNMNIINFLKQNLTNGCSLILKYDTQ